MALLGWALSLTAAYWLITLAEQQKDFTRTLGKIIAWVIIVVCILGLLAHLGKHGKHQGGRMGHGWAQGYPGGGRGGWQKWNRGGWSRGGGKHHGDESCSKGKCDKGGDEGDEDHDEDDD
jgi:hypothetical protein